MTITWEHDSGEVRSQQIIVVKQRHKYVDDTRHEKSSKNDMAIGKS